MVKKGRCEKETNGNVRSENVDFEIKIPVIDFIASY